MRAARSASVASVLREFNVSRPKEAISREKALGKVDPDLPLYLCILQYG